MFRFIKQSRLSEIIMPGSRFIVALRILCAGFLLQAQDFDSYRDRVKEDFATFRQEKMTEFEKYRDQLNLRFSEALGNSWLDRTARAPMARPRIPGPSKPIVSDDKFPDKAITVDVGDEETADVKSFPPPVSPPSGKVRKCLLEFDFFNTRCGIGSRPWNLKLSGIDNSAVSGLWLEISTDWQGADLLDDCLSLRDDLNLCDWAYLLLTEKVSRTIISSDRNAANLLWVWLMCQSGYDVRPAVADGELILLFSADRQIYERPVYIMDGRKYYPVHPPERGYGNLRAVDRMFSTESVPLRLVMDKIPRFADTPLPEIYSSSSWKNAPPIEVPIGAQLASFLSGYPLVDWTVYAASEISPWVRTTVIEAMRLITDGMDEAEAVNTILEYSQRGFDYMTDGDQFGAEKPFFFEENFVYPFNDCEDRAILFARLVHEVLGLDVVFLHYPNHLCAAVDVPGRESGYNVTVDGRKFRICDPCYIPSVAGSLAPAYRKSVPVIIRITF